jgi:hypothetical protein
MNINQRILNAYNLSKMNIDIVEILEEIEIDLVKTDDLTLEAFEVYDMLKYKYDKQYRAAVDRVAKYL